MFTRLNSSALMPCLDSLDLDEEAPNKRLKLTGPAFRGTVRLCTSQHITQHGALAPAGARPAA